MTIFVNDGNGEREVQDIHNVQEVLVNHGSGEEKVWPTAPESDPYYNLAHYLPDRALAIKDRQPDDYQAALRTQDVTSYAGGNGDLADAIETASSNNRIAYLGSNNTYTISSTASALGTHFGVIGENCTINVESNMRMALSGTCQVAAVTGVTFDSTNAEAGILEALVSDEFWSQDVTVEGERNRDVSNATGNYNWVVHMTDTSAEGLVENLSLPDGEYWDRVGDVPGGGARTQGVTVDPGHDGYLVYKDCYVEGFMGNGYYMAYNPYHEMGDGWSPGSSIMWNCTAVDNNRTGIRLGYNDMCIGGKVVANDNTITPIGLSCHYATGAEDNPTRFIGTHLEGDAFRRTAMFTGLFWYTNGNPVWIEFEKITLSNRSRSIPMYFTTGNSDSPNRDYVDEHASTANVLLKDCYLHDGYSGTNPDGNAMSDFGFNSNVTIEDTRMSSNTREALMARNGSHGFSVDGSSYGNETVSLNELGLQDPHIADGSLPDFYFDYSVITDYDIEGPSQPPSG